MTAPIHSSRGDVPAACPPAVKKSIQAYDWFPTFSFFGAPYTKTIGLQGRNARRNAEGSTGARGDYKPAQLSQQLVGKN